MASILLAEDDADIGFVVKFMLERAGYQVFHASDGRMAQEYIRGNAPTSLAILDIMLPFVDGYQLLRDLRESPAWKSVPVIMLTAKSQGPDIVRALDSGANDYVRKPFEPEELMARVRRFVSPAPKASI